MARTKQTERKSLTTRKGLTKAAKKPAATSGAPGPSTRSTPARQGAARRKPATPTRSRVVPKRRNKPGVVALREIRRYQNSTDMLMPRAPLMRVVREIMQELGQGKENSAQRITSSALEAIQMGLEAYLTALFADANLAAIHARRVTIMVKDIALILTLRGHSDPGKSVKQ